jgi:hypothetical protein
MSVVRVGGVYVNQISTNNFGIVIAFIIPGIILLLGLAGVVPAIETLLWANADSTAPSVVGAIYLLIVSIGLGVLISGLRYFTIDTLLRWSSGRYKIGCKLPAISYANLAGKQAEYTGLIENYYKFYQFYANSLVALIITFVLIATTENKIFDFPSDTSYPYFTDLFISGLLFFSANDSFKKYCKNTEELLKAKGTANDKRSTSRSGGGEKKTRARGRAAKRD